MSDPTGLTIVHRFGRQSSLEPAIKRLLPDVSLVPWPGPGEVLVTFDTPWREEAAEELPDSIRWVHVLGAGVGGFPFHALRGRPITCSKGASSVAIAEWVLAVMLAFEKQLPESWITSPPPSWSGASLGSLAGKTLSLIGIGAIGTEVARRAAAFDMNIVALRRSNRPAPLSGVTLAPSLESAVAEADHVVITAPSTPETDHMIDASAFRLMKDGVHLVNIARGALVDQGALLAALDSGKVGRASLDVVDPEPLPGGHPLYTHPGVRLSPHISWSAPSSMPQTLQLFVDNLKRYQNKEPLNGLVDVEAGY